MTTPQTETSSSNVPALAAALAGLYAQAEQAILRGVGVILGKRWADPTSRYLAVRKLVRGVAAELGQKSPALAHGLVVAAARKGASLPLVQGSVTHAVPLAMEQGNTRNVLEPYTPGRIDAHVSPAPTVPQGGNGSSEPPTPPVSPLGGNGTNGGESPFDFSKPTSERAIQAVLDDLNSELEDVRFRITRLDDDIYKQIAPGGAIHLLTDNTQTMVDAMRSAYQEFLENGVTGFTDKGGRDWTLTAYTEMAVRTAAQRASNNAHMQQMLAAGAELFTIPPDLHPCPLCFPWQGKILSVKPDHRADATIAEATAQGLFHPNCQHNLTMYVPGVTELHKPGMTDEEAAEKFKKSQRQRALEREIRKAKQKIAYSDDPQTVKEAKEDLAAARAKLRDLEAGGFTRARRREQINLTDDRPEHGPMKTPAPPLADSDPDLPSAFAERETSSYPGRLTGPEYAASGRVDRGNNWDEAAEVPIADWLEQHNLRVWHVARNTETKSADAIIAHTLVPVEFKTATTGSVSTLMKQISNARKQAPLVVLDLRSASHVWMQEEAQQIVDRIGGRNIEGLDGLLVIGQGFSLQWSANG
ncbi:phage minor capsid protein [Gryllotalpicola koreensis]|uniref:tRNA nuclease CdiA C-terminal domain-containing protein n=1 Tax=Gryllotalpicola koreensis TaxID=993086 RepID=A0ABP8A248_9MICO